MNYYQIQDSKIDILEWWYKHKNTLPHLCLLVQDYLCVPASSAKSECTFSAAGNIAKKTRNRLIPENVNMLRILVKSCSYIPDKSDVTNEETLKSNSLRKSDSFGVTISDLVYFLGGCSPISLSKPCDFF